MYIYHIYVPLIRLADIRFSRLSDSKSPTTVETYTIYILNFCSQVLPIRKKKKTSIYFEIKLGF